MTLSIVIVNYNVRYFLELCLSSVQEAITSMDAEIIVVDNNSPDDSCSMVKSRFPEVVLIENKKNVGFSKANNQGVAVAQGEYICILNPDTVVGETVFEQIHAFAKAHPKAGAIGARLLDGTGAFLPECKRNLPTPKVAFQKIFGSGNLYYARHLKHTENGKVSILVGAFMFLKRSIYQEVGGFDERYFMYGEDIDLSYTIEKAGYTNYYFGEALVIHFKGESTSKDAIYRKRFYGAMRIFYEKHFKTNVLQRLGVRLGLFLATLSRKRTSKPSEPISKEYTLITNNRETAQKLKETVKKEILVSESYDGDAGKELIFDANYKSYASIIDTMRSNQNRGLTFKCIPKNSTFAIGSDSSEGRGVLYKW